MIIKQTKYKKCKSCGRSSFVSGPVYGCDCCGKEFTEEGRLEGSLQASVFYADLKETSNFHYCSWKCCLKHLKTVKTDYFISLPYLLFDERKNGACSAAAFFKELKNTTTKKKKRS